MSVSRGDDARDNGHCGEPAAVEKRLGRTVSSVSRVVKRAASGADRRLVKVIIGISVYNPQNL